MRPNDLEICITLDVIDRAQRRANDTGLRQAIVLRGGELAVTTARSAIDPLEIVRPCKC